MKRSMITAVCVQAAVVAMVSAVKVANGDTIRTYTIVDYPAYQTDNAGGTDHVSGTITADETTQTIQSFTLAIQAAGGTTYTATSGFTIQPNVRVAITDTQILITEPTVPVPTYQDSSGGFLGLQANWGGSGNNYVSVSWMSEVAAGGIITLRPMQGTPAPATWRHTLRLPILRSVTPTQPLRRAED